MTKAKKKYFGAHNSSLICHVIPAHCPTLIHVPLTTCFYLLAVAELTMLLQYIWESVLKAVSL